jgi:peptide/nickel transport system substrate-binding protein
LAGLLSRRALGALLLCSGAAQALGRTPLGGTLRLALPLPFAGLDPHTLDSPLAALFGAAISDPLYALDASGRPYPTLATALPEKSADGALVRVRPGLVSAAGKALDARDVSFSLERTRKLGGAGILAPFARPKVGADRLSLTFPGADPEALASALAAPVTALLPRGFSKLSPDGSGPFAASLSPGKLLLTRNLNAARGAAFLERIEVSRARDLAEGLRAFETGRSDVGWLGAGLYRSRPGARQLSGPSYGWVVLRTGRDAKTWGASGLAQQLCDQLPAGQLAHLGVSTEPGARRGVAWGGGPAELLVSEDDPHLVQIASSLAALLSSPGHEVQNVASARGDFEGRRASGRYVLMLDFVRNLGASAELTLLALLTAVDPELAKRPPRLTNPSPSEIARTLPLGVVGALNVAGAQIGELQALAAWALGAVWWKKS